MNTQRRRRVAALRFMPLEGVLIGAVGGGVYWTGSQFWPASIAVILSMLATTVLAARLDAAATRNAAREGAAAISREELLGTVLGVLIKYSALMALSAAVLPFALPPNLALGFFMVAGHAASRALLVSALGEPASRADLGVALVLGFAPAALIGIPGLIGLVAAIAARVALMASRRPGRPALAGGNFDLIRPVSEVCFYLGALASLAYI